MFLINSQNYIKKIGTGIGLNLFKKAAKQMGGKIELKPAISKGTTGKGILPNMVKMF